MGIGDDIKDQADAVRNKLGAACTLNGADIGICSFNDLPPTETQNLGMDYSDEVATAWTVIETEASVAVKEGDKIIVTLTGRSWVVRRVVAAQAAGVLIAHRCFCVGKGL